MRAESIRYLQRHRFNYKPAESPDIQTHLESLFTEPNRIGPKFISLPQNLMADLIGRGEDALLNGLMVRHRKTGKLMPVTQVLEMPYVVGTDSVIEIGDADKKHLIELIDQPGTPHERVIHLLRVEADAIPATHHVTVTGGIYADGRTAGYYSLQAGKHAGKKKAVAILATAEDIRWLTDQMVAKLDEITLIPQHEARAMVAKARKALKL